MRLPCPHLGLLRCCKALLPIILVLLAGIISFPVFQVSAREYLPGVIAGDTVDYNVTVTWLTDSALLPEPSNFQQLNTTSHLMFQVTLVSGSNATLQISQYLENQTIRNGALTLDVRTGVANSTGLVPLDLSSLILIASDLGSRDPISEGPMSPTFNMTETTTIRGISRMVNLLNYTLSSPTGTIEMGLAWDQSSGVLVEASVFETVSEETGISGQGSISLVMTGTNIWTSFLISATPNPLTLTRPSVGTATIQLRGLNGFTGSLRLSATSPPGVTVYISPSTVAIPPYNKTAITVLEVSVSSILPLGLHSLTVNATTSHASRYTTLKLILVANTQLSCGSAGTCFILADANITRPIFSQGNIHFSAIGPSASTSFVNVTIPRTATSSIDDIHVSLDGIALPGSAVTITSNGIDYFVYFNFTLHSSVNIDIFLTQARPLTILGLNSITLSSILAGVAIAITFGILVFRKKRRDSPQPEISNAQ